MRIWKNWNYIEDWRLKIGVVRGVSKLYLRYHTRRFIAISHIHEINTRSNSTTIPTTQHIGKNTPSCHLVSPMHLRSCKMFTLLVILASLLAFPQLLGLWGQDPDVFCVEMLILIYGKCALILGSAGVPLSLFYMLRSHWYHFDIRESFQNNAANVFRVGKTFWFPIHDSHHLQGAKLLQSLIWSPAWSGSSWSSW